MAEVFEDRADTPDELRGAGAVVVADPKPAAAGLAALIAAAVLIAAPFAAGFEGFVPKARPDPAKIPTYCFGETQHVDPLRIYSKTECMALLRARMARDYAPKIAQCLPQVTTNRFIFAALIDASYNAGPVGVCKSAAAAHFRAGARTAGCNALRGWYVTARDRKTGVVTRWPGLERRRNAEADLCLRGVA